MTKKFIEYLPLFTITIVVLALLKLFLFYNNFSLSIKNFISIAELSIIISEDVMFFMFFLLFSYGANYVFDDNKDALKLPLKIPNFKILKGILIILFNLGLFAWIIFEKKYHNKIICFSLIFYGFFFTLMGTTHFRDFKKRHPNLSIFISTTLFVAAMTSIMTGLEIKSVVGGKYFGTKVFTTDSIYHSNDSSYYIGQTEKYVFIFNKKEYCTIIPVSNIKKIEIHSK